MEPQIRAQAGLQPQSTLRRLLSALAVQSYLPNPNDTRYLALDLSQFNTLSLATVSQVTNPVVRSLMIRIGGSATVKDTKFPVFWPLAKELGIPHDIYMYNWPGWTVDQHIRNFMDSVGQHCDGDLGNIIWVDAECHADKTKRQVSDNTYGVVEAIGRETGKPVGVYSGLWFINGYMEIQDWMSDTKWWLAQWISDQHMEHPGPPQTISAIPRENILWHQTGSRCQASIYNGTGYVDTDRWCLSENKYKEIYDIVEEEEPIPADWWPTYSQINERVLSIEGRLAEIENRVGRHLQA